ncbi:hypothetical protein HDU96_008158 [Phlyctochytrium bullatum]|nr:hypothetical protein HDU96_008158 [Phlyctochytrium bullatum]
MKPVPLCMRRYESTVAQITKENGMVGNNVSEEAEAEEETASSILVGSMEAASTLHELITRFRARSVEAKQFQAQCVELINKSQPGDPALEPITSQDWETIFKTLNSARTGLDSEDNVFFKQRMNLYDTTIRAWELMTASASRPQVTPNTVIGFCRALSRFAGQGKMPRSDALLEILKAAEGMNSSLIRSAYVTLGMGLAERRIVVPAWWIVKGLHNAVIKMEREESPEKSCPMFHSEADYDRFLKQFRSFRIPEQNLEKAAEARKCLEGLLEQKRFDGYTVEQKNVRPLAYLAVTEEEIVAFKKKCKADWLLDMDAKMYFDLVRNSIYYAKNLDLAADLIIAGIKAQQFPPEEGLIYASTLIRGENHHHQNLLRFYRKIIEALSESDANFSSRLVLATSRNILQEKKLLRGRSQTLKHFMEAVPSEILQNLQPLVITHALKVAVKYKDAEFGWRIYRACRRQILELLKKHPRILHEQSTAARETEGLAELPDTLSEIDMAASFAEDIVNLDFNLRLNAVPKAKTLFDEVRATGFAWTTDIYSYILKTYGYHQPHLIKEFTDEMFDRRVPRNEQYYSVAMKSAARRANNLESYVLMRMAEDGMNPNSFVYNAIIDSAVKKNDMAKAKAVKTQMISVGVKPNTVTYNIFLNGFLVRGMWDQANAVLAEMDEAGVPRDTTTFNTLISAHGRREGGDPVEGKRLYEAMLHPPFSLQPDEKSLGALVSCHVALKEWDELKALFAEAKKFDTSAFSMYLKGLTDESVIAADPTPFLDEIDRVIINIVQAAVPMHPTTFATLIRAAGKLHDGDRVKRYIEATNLRVTHRTSDTVNGAIITALDTLGDYDGAVAHANAMVPGSGVGQAFSEAEVETAEGKKALAESHFRIGRGSVFALMIAHAKKKNADLVHAVWEQLGRLEKAGIAFKDPLVNRSGYSINEMNVAMQCYNFLGMIDRAKELWEKCFIVSPSQTQQADKSDAVDTTKSKSRVVTSSLFSRGLVERYGVDRITVSQILDLVGGPQGNPEDLHSIWNQIRHEKFPVDLNNWISYLEGLARHGGHEELITLVGDPNSELRKEFELTAKVFRTTLPLLHYARQESALSKLCQLLETEHADLVPAVQKGLELSGKTMPLIDQIRQRLESMK